MLKDSVFIKTVEVSSGAPPCDAPRDAPCDTPCSSTTFHFTMQRTVQAPYFRTFAPLPGYLSHQAPEDACFVEEGCLGGTGTRKVHHAVHLAKYCQHVCTVARGACRVGAGRMHCECLVHARYTHGT